MNIGKLFEPKQRDVQLRGALKRIRAKKGGEYPFAFAITGKEGILIVDWRGEATAEKLMKHMRKQRPTKIIVGKARIKGPLLELRIEQQKGTVKSKDVRNYLSKNGLPVRKAKIIEANSNPQSRPEFSGENQRHAE